MLDQIIFTEPLPYLEDPEPTQPVLIAINKATRSKNALIDCVFAALNEIEQANRNYDCDRRRIAIIEYNNSLKRARSSSVSQATINKKCHQVHFQCLAANLMGIALATVTGDYYNRIETLLEWYEDDRHRMTEVGFHASAIDSRMAKIKLKLVKK